MLYPTELRPQAAKECSRIDSRGIPGGNLDQIAFSSLLIGLLVGVQPVSVDIAPAIGAAAIVFSRKNHADQPAERGRPGRRRLPYRAVRTRPLNSRAGPVAGCSEGTAR